VNVDSKKKKEMIALGVLGALALYLVYTNLLAGPSIPETEHPKASAKADEVEGALSMPGAIPKKAAAKGRKGSRDEGFHPIYIPARKEDRPDPTTIDPTMHLELLTKLENVEPAGATRNLFAFGMAPPPKPVEPPKGPEPKVTLASASKTGGPVPPPLPLGKGKDAGPPPEPPLHIDLKYYGIIAYSRGGIKTACFMDGDQILTASEGDTLKRRYKVVRISNTSVLMEDSESKRQATLPIEKEAQS
jgi:hypothetical protein